MADRFREVLKLFGDCLEGRRAVRLCYAEGDRAFVAGEDRSPDPGRQLAEVTGFVPRSARRYWIEYTDDKGEVRSGAGWGDTPPFLRD